MIKKLVIPGNSDRPLAVTVAFQNRLTWLFSALPQPCQVRIDRRIGGATLEANSDDEIADDDPFQTEPERRDRCRPFLMGGTFSSIGSDVQAAMYRFCTVVFRRLLLHLFS